MINESLNKMELNFQEMNEMKTQQIKILQDIAKTTILGKLIALFMFEKRNVSNK